MSSPTTPASIGPGEFFPVVGVGPHDKPWPEGDQYDPELLLNGDRRNVLDLSLIHISEPTRPY